MSYDTCIMEIWIALDMIIMTDNKTKNRLDKATGFILLSPHIHKNNTHEILDFSPVGINLTIPFLRN